MPYKNKEDRARKELERYRKRRAEAFQILGTICALCKTEKATELDHIDRSSKSFNISAMWFIGRDRFFNELRKCQPVCSPCHKRKTREEMTDERSGEGNPASKLNREKVALIRQRYQKGSRTNGARAMAREFGVTHQAVLLVLQGKTWK